MKQNTTILFHTIVISASTKTKDVTLCSFSMATVTEDGMVDSSYTIAGLYALSSLMFWLLLVILFVKFIRAGLSGNVVAAKAGKPSDKTNSAITRHFLRQDRERTAMGLRAEKVARSYLSTKLGQVHLTALGICATSTFILGIWTLAKNKTAHDSRQLNEISEAYS